MRSASQFYKLGLIGYPVSHSLSPLMHRAALCFCELEGSYELLPVSPEELDERVRTLAASGYNGFNVTVPHKQAVFALVDTLTVEAERVRAVNTVRINRDGSLTGHNTDLGGFVNSVKEYVPASPSKAGRPCVLLGAGGAARAALWGLIDLGVPEVVIVVRNHQQGSEMMSEIVEACAAGKARSHTAIRIMGTTDEQVSSLNPYLLINSTRIGLGEAELPDWLKTLVAATATDAACLDMVYAGVRNTTPLVKRVRDAGWKAKDGLEMLVGQASLAFQFWTQREVPISVMAEALETSETAGC